MMRLVPSSIVSSIVCCVLVVAPFARADGTSCPRCARPVDADPAAAEALFHEARALMREHAVVKACSKLEESLRLDYGIGTEWNLAECHERLGKPATAWSEYLSVAAAARAKNQTAREKAARERARTLEPRLPRLVIDVPDARPGLEVKRDGSTVGDAAWGMAVPVDPGPHRVTVAAPGRPPWETTVRATEATVSRVTVPREPLAAAESSPAAMMPLGVSEAPPLARPRPPGSSDPAKPPKSERNVPALPAAQRTIGYVVGGLGVAGVAVGAGFGIDALVSRSASEGHCNGDTCDAEGVTLRERAMRSGDIATVATIAGAAALAGGIVLFVTSPKRSDSPVPARSVSLRPTAPPSDPSGRNAGVSGGGLVAAGTF